MSTQPQPRCRPLFPAILAALATALIAPTCLAGAGEDLLEAYKLHRMGDTEHAMPIWLRMAQQGQVDAEYNLGVVYHHGDGVARDYAEAMKWYGLAAEAGDVEAQRALGSMYMRGEGVAQNEQVGMRVMLLSLRMHHQHAVEVAQRWAGQLEHAIWHVDPKPPELLEVKSPQESARIIAELRRRAGLDGEPAPLVGLR